MITDVTIVAPKTTALEKRGAALVERANTLAVSTVEEHADALNFIKDCKDAERAGVELFAAPKKLAHQTHRAITTSENQVVRPFIQARQIVTKKAVDFSDEQERIAAEKRRAAEKVAREEAEAEALKQAAAAQDAGDDIAAEEILDEATHTPPPVVFVEPEVAKVEGVSGRKTWSAEVTSLAALIKWVAQNPESQNLLQANQTALNGMARAQQENMRIPGVRAVGKSGLAVRG